MTIEVPPETENENNKINKKGAKENINEYKNNEKIENTGWKPNYSLDDGIQELIKTYTILISDLSSKYRNGFPLSYGNRT